MQRINWIPALILYCVASVLSLMVDLTTIVRGSEAGDVLALLILPVLIVAVVFCSMLHYACWQALPARYRSTTPAKAVGFLFIPIFNFYWAFISFAGLAKGYWQYQQETGISEIRNVTGLGITYAIVLVLSLTIGFLPGVASIITLADLVTFIFFYQAISTYANLAIAYERERSQ